MMKTNSLLRLGMMAALIMIIVAAGCKKPKDGTDGTNGANGTNGTMAQMVCFGADGLNGTVGDVWCKTCHNEANWTAVQNQLAASCMVMQQI